MKNFNIYIITIISVLGCKSKHAEQINTETRHKPELAGAWWQVAGNPNLGEYTSEKQQPVDFGIWQAGDGTWQIWSCIRQTKEVGHTRLFHRWEGDSLTQSNWKEMGVAMRADTTLGENAGGLQAPFVIKKDDKYLMFYGDWYHICLAESEDGKIFERVITDGSPALFGDPAETNTRDPMLINIQGQWYCYYTAHPDNDGAIYLRKSDDLKEWGASKIVSHGGSPGTGQLWMAECPHVIPYEGKYYLFRTYSYGKYENGVHVEEPKTNVYCSDDPENFGVDTDSLLVSRLPVAAPEIIHYNGEWYMAALIPDLQGIRISKLVWMKVD